MKRAPNSNVLTREEVFPLLIEVSPQFESIWQEFYEDWKGDREGLPYYVCPVTSPGIWSISYNSAFDNFSRV